jgi:hypothetical protein
MNWTRKHAFWAGTALILATNAIVLGGAAYNRSGEPDSVLKLTQRELALPYAWGLTRENSGLELRILWRAIEQNPNFAAMVLASSYGMSFAPQWLDEAKLAALGIDVAKLRRVGSAEPSRNLLPSKEVFLVLEFDGPGYRTLLDQVRAYTAAAAERLRIIPDDKELQQRAKVAAEVLKREEQDNSRLIVIDAGLDKDALRAKYPDRTHYAIVRGRIAPEAARDDSHKPHARIVGLSVSTVNVPVAFRSAVGDARPMPIQVPGNEVAPYDVTVSFGRRLEPWVTGAAKLARGQ